MHLANIFRTYNDQQVFFFIHERPQHAGYIVNQVLDGKGLEMNFHLLRLNLREVENAIN